MQRRKGGGGSVIVNWFNSTPPSYVCFLFFVFCFNLFFHAALIYNNTSVVRCLRSAKLGRLRSRGSQWGGQGVVKRLHVKLQIHGCCGESWGEKEEEEGDWWVGEGKLHVWFPSEGVHDLIMTRRKPSPPLPQMPAEVPSSHAAPKRCARVLMLPAFCDFSLGPLRTKKKKTRKGKKTKINK